MIRDFSGRLTWYGMVTFRRQARLADARNQLLLTRLARGDFSHRHTARGEVDHCGLFHAVDICKCATLFIRKNMLFAGVQANSPFPQTLEPVRTHTRTHTHTDYILLLRIIIMIVFVFVRSRFFFQQRSHQKSGQCCRQHGDAPVSHPRWRDATSGGRCLQHDQRAESGRAGLVVVWLRKRNPRL